ncbi:MAG: FkbM family methyltransferase [Burkholderiaceae bacterium]|nr:FkbM family methyltransferase [Burkholderiaceae bacterium]
MAMVELQIKGGHRPCTMRLDLDPANPNEAILINHLFRGLFYEPDTSRIFTRVLREGDTVIDVGGNCGYFAMLAAALVGPNGRVVTFEPDPANCERLRGNIALNGFTNVILVEQPALESVRPVTFYINDENSGGDALWNSGELPDHSEATRTLSLTGTTLDIEIARLGLDNIKLVKVDTEGADHMVLQGAGELLRGGKVPFYLCELHEFALGQMGTSQAGFRDYMADFGYDTFAVMFDGSLPHMVPRRTRIDSQFICNMLFTRGAELAPYWPVHQQNPGDLYGNPGDVVVSATDLRFG